MDRLGGGLKAGDNIEEKWKITILADRFIVEWGVWLKGKVWIV